MYLEHRDAEMTSKFEFGVNYYLDIANTSIADAKNGGGGGSNGGGSGGGGGGGQTGGGNK
ncbi:MAG: hypothetical protein J1E61_06005 [Lachnospiraceae bacterium]|nr:hypothetical protein [Lachnospiraceae bacterium]